MASRPTSISRLDRIAMTLSGVCVVHCFATAILLGLLSAAGGFLGKPIIHEVVLSLAMILGAIALGRGVVEHGFVLPALVGAAGLAIMAYALTMHETGMEPVYTVVGVLILALGHRLNSMAAEPV
jgi:MerC mercury resistance protein